MSPVSVLELLVGLLDFTTQCYPDSLENVDGVLKSAAEALEELGFAGHPDAETSALVEQLLALSWRGQD